MVRERREGGRKIQDALSQRSQKKKHDDDTPPFPPPSPGALLGATYLYVRPLIRRGIGSATG
jgi:hypothetical protein